MHPLLREKVAPKQRMKDLELRTSEGLYLEGNNGQNLRKTSRIDRKLKPVTAQRRYSELKTRKTQEWKLNHFNQQMRLRH